jgi:hypothetical protein
VSIFCAARMPHDDVLVGIVAREVHIVGQFAHMGGARHTGVSISNVKPARVANIPVSMFFTVLEYCGACTIATGGGPPGCGGWNRPPIRVHYACTPPGGGGMPGGKPCFPTTLGGKFIIGDYPNAGGPRPCPRKRQSPQPCAVPLYPPPYPRALNLLVPCPALL